MEIFRDFFAANCGKGLQIAARDCKGRQGTANGGKGVYTHIADFYRSRGTDYTENRSFCLFRGSLSPYFLFIGLFRGNTERE